jgi:hypothetical protein
MRCWNTMLLLAAGLFILLAQAPPAIAQTQPAGEAVSDRPVTCGDIDLSRPMTEDELQDLRLCQELQKLREEVASLQSTNNAARSGLGFLLPFSGIVTGVAAAMAVLLVPFMGNLVRNSFERSQRQKLEQERALQREQHNLKLMEGLGSSNRAVQLASIASLLRRIDELKRRSGRQDDQNTEIKTLSDVVVSVLRDPEIEEGVSKYLADEMVNVFDLRVADRGQRDQTKAFSLREFNLSRARLKGVYWANVDATGVDFFQADLSGASLRDADLSKAVFYETNLQGAVLAGARLHGANLQAANLKGANLKAVDFTGATNLNPSSLDSKTRWDDQTKWPAGFDVAAIPQAVA